jgi:HlyD family secretion protein
MRSPLVLCLAALAFVGCSQPDESRWSGYIEGEYVYVAAPLGGALEKLAVQRGQDVAAGTPLFTLEDAAERAAREEAAARLASARAQAADTEKGRRAQEIEITRAQLEQARVQATLAAAELTRQQQLMAQGFVSSARLDDAQTAARQAQARVEELTAALRVAQMPARVDERRAAAASAQAARYALEQTQWRELQKRQSAPVEGRVADTFFRVGEWVGAGQPVIALLPPGATKARFFVPESELGSIAVGQRVAIHCDGCGAPIAARIDFIATQAEYTPPVIYSNSQRARLVFMVEARPDPKQGLRLKPGQPVDVQRLAAQPADPQRTAASQ